MIKVGLLGSSAIAREHARAVEVNGGVVHAFSSKSESSLNSREMSRVFPNAQYKPIGEFLQDAGLDFIVSCLPVDLTDLYFEELLSCGKPILFEKPPFISSPARLCELNGSSLDQHWVGFNKRFFSTVQKLKEKLSEEVPLYAELIISENLTAAWEKYPALSYTDYLYFSSSSHLLDLCQYLFGRLTVKRSEQIFNNGGHLGFFGEFRSDHGVPIAFNIIANNPVSIGISCIFPSGERWVLSPMESLSIFLGYDVIQPTSSVPYKRYTPKLISSEAVDSGIAPGLEAQMAEFLSQRRVVGSSLQEFKYFSEIVKGVKNINAKSSS
jgi:predicted dehydrogenase